MVVLNSDTILCTILENGMDWITFYFKGLKHTIFPDNIKVGENYKSYPNSVSYISFKKDSLAQFTTSDLIRKIDFSEGSPYLKKRKDFATKTYYYVVDTTGNELYWFGIDFSNVRITLDSEPRINYGSLFFQDCNDFAFIDPSFQEFRKYFNLKIDTGDVIARNNRIYVKSIYNIPGEVISIDNMKSIINTFHAGGNGIGVVIFVSDINKEIEFVTFYVTFFDIKSKSVLLSLKETAKGWGIGVARHWTKGIHDYLLNLIKRHSWKKKYTS
jgi:hypothetical protein